MQEDDSAALPARRAPHLGKIDIGPLPKVLTTMEALTLRRDALAIPHNLVARANSRYCPVRMVKVFLP